MWEKTGKKMFEIFGALFVILSIVIVFKGGIAFILPATFFLLMGIALTLNSK